jgi:hypothetical protein
VDGDGAPLPGETKLIVCRNSLDDMMIERRAK